MITKSWYVAVGAVAIALLGKMFKGKNSPYQKVPAILIVLAIICLAGWGVYHGRKELPLTPQELLQPYGKFINNNPTFVTIRHVFFLLFAALCPDDEAFLYQLIDWKIPFVLNLSHLNTTEHDKVFLFISQLVYTNVFLPAMANTTVNELTCISCQKLTSQHPHYTEIIQSCRDGTSTLHTVVLPNERLIRGYQTYRRTNPYLFDPLAYGMHEKTLVHFPSCHYKRVAQHLRS